VSIISLTVKSASFIITAKKVAAKEILITSDINNDDVFPGDKVFVGHFLDLKGICMKSRIFLVLFSVLFLLSFSPVLGYAEDDRTIQLTVEKNHNLINLCRKYLEDPSKWPEVGRINRLKDFNLIHTGQSLIIPVRLLKGVPLDGRVLFVKGDVALRAAGGESWMVLRPNDPVGQGGLVRTKQESVVEISFDDGTSFLLQSDTTLDLNRAEKKGAVHLFQRLILPLGRMLIKVRRATGQDSRIEIQTPSATAVARGTDFRVSVDSRETMISEILKGNVDVEAMKEVVMLKEGEGTRVDRGAPPLKPRMLLPPPVPEGLQPLYRTMPFFLKVESVEGAVAHRLQLSADPEGKDVVRGKVLQAGEALEVKDLDDGTYYFQGGSVDGIGIEGLPLAPRMIRVRTNPSSPFIQEPTAGTRFKGKSVSFRWLKVRDAARYQLQISRDPEFRDTTGDLMDLPEVSHDRTFDDFGSYYFRIRSLAADSYEGIWSDVIAFTLDPPPPSPVMEKPAVDEKELRLRWQDRGHGMSYRFQIAREEGFQNLFLEKKVDRPEITVPKPEEPGLYYVRTSTIDPTGYEGGFSLPQSFEIKRVEVKAEIKKDCTTPYILGASFLGLFGLLLLILF
jgi:hypothetical protein